MTEQDRPGLSWTHCRTEQDSAGEQSDRTAGEDGARRQRRTVHYTTRQNRAGQDREEEDMTGQAKTRQDSTGQARPAHGKGQDGTERRQDVIGRDRTGEQRNGQNKTG